MTIISKRAFLEPLREMAEVLRWYRSRSSLWTDPEDFLLVNGVIVTLGGIYASTHSVPVTAVAGCVLASAMLYGWKKLRDEEERCRECPRVSANGRAT